MTKRKWLLVAAAVVIPGGFVMLGVVWLGSYLRKRSKKIEAVDFAHCQECVRLVTARATINFVGHLRGTHGLTYKQAEQLFRYIFGSVFREFAERKRVPRR